MESRKRRNKMFRSLLVVTVAVVGLGGMAQATEIKLDLSDPHAYEFRTRLQEGAKLPPNFAGHYRVVTWSCGTGGCLSGAVIDKATGHVVFLPSDVEFNFVDFNLFQHEIKFQTPIFHTTDDGEDDNYSYMNFDGKSFHQVANAPPCEAQWIEVWGRKVWFTGKIVSDGNDGPASYEFDFDNKDRSGKKHDEAVKQLQTKCLDVLEE